MPEIHTHVVSFKYFKDTEEFENWQIQNPTYKVAIVSPIFEKMYISLYNDYKTGSEDNSEFAPEYEVFVTFLKPIKREE